MLLIYLFQVMPMTEAADEQTDKEAALQDENSGLKEDNTQLQGELEHSNIMNQAYEHVIHGNPEEAVSLLESVASLDEAAEEILFEQYLLLNTAESLEKAVDLRIDDPIRLVEELRRLNNEEANAAILSIDSDVPEVIIEQARMNDAFETVIETFANIEEN